METKTKVENSRDAKTSSEDIAEPPGTKGFLRKMLPYLAGEKRNILFAVIASALTGFCLAIQPLVIKYIVDDGIGAANPADPGLVAFFARLFGHTGAVSDDFRIKIIGALALFYLAVAFCRICMWGFGIRHMLAALEGTLFSLRSRFFNHIQHLCMRFYDKNSSGDLFNCIMGSPMANIRTYLNSIVMNVPHQAVALVISLIALFSYDKRLTLILLLTAAAMTFLNFLSRKKIRRTSGEYLSAERAASRYITDLLHGTNAVKLYSIEDRVMQDADRCLEEMKRKGVSSSFSIVLEHFKPEFLQYVGIAVVYFVGGFYCVTNGLSVGVLYAFLSSMTSILTIFSSWLNIALQRSAAEVALNRIEDVMQEHTSTPEIPDGKQRSIEVERRSAMAQHKPCISFRNVSFSYDGKAPVFKNFRCDIAYGESIGLVGASGSGKSTLTKLVMRLYDISEGEILLHGRDIRSYAIHDLRMSFGVVPQAPFIFNRTIWDNIRIVRPDAPNQEIIRAMEVAHVHEFVNKLPDGWATVIGDGGVALSGGQIQRIAIARAVLRNPDILIFDEATSALDNISERHIREAMEELMKTHTVLIVAHRLSTIRNVNRILVFDNGNIVEEGTYDELASREGAFRNLLDSPKDKE